MLRGDALTWASVGNMIQFALMYLPHLNVRGVDSLPRGDVYWVHPGRGIIYYDNSAPEQDQLRYIAAALTVLWDKGAERGVPEQVRRRWLHVVNIEPQARADPQASGS
jgi:hypothetical protein